MYQTVLEFFNQSGFGQFQWGNGVMILIGFLFIYLAIAKRFEPLLLVPIGFGILVGNIPYDTRSLSLGVYDGPASEADLHYYKVIGKERKGSVITLDSSVLSLYRSSHEGKNALEISRQQGEKDARKEGKKYSLEYGIKKGTVVIVNEHAKLAYSGEIKGPSIIDMGQGRYIFVKEPAPDNRYPVIIQPETQEVANAGFFYLIFQGVALGIFPPLIFLGVGALTDFGPMLSNPRTLLLGASAQIGIFGALLGALLIGFDIREAASIGIIGGADGPTSIFVCTALAPDLLGAVALAAYSYMAMVPIIQPPIMKALTTKQERLIRMDPPSDVSRRTRIMFPVLGFLLTAFITPAALPLLGMLFFGNLLRESLVTDRLSKTAQNALIDIVTIMLGISVGAKTQAATFLTWQTIGIFAMGIVAFVIATACGVLLAKLLNKVSDKPINPLIGAAGVSAVPMAARVVHNVGQKEDPHNFLLMHAMGPNVAGVIGSAVAAGVLLSALG
uniref:oxaloacetate decarboxylase (Na(+) extruding) n=1 Tax=Candidatus Kentrum sp. TC TaxID=2126339 RepID=A0A450Z0M7_9GAMM|nr:MAG: oxaloacetate decarboxylase, beta subunit [Candidatus Kentron sp. TC]VFK47385.1 MAG: oxaloacetate decarboxylase, beta subunit [Candidatus Kentron sp. TC]VFK59614.1 MAG: oxaloacetate decarboxylase, beta subunit [Candidatus Kentron sp. TC]